MIGAERLTELPLGVFSAWKSKVVTTNPPKYIPHDEWRLEVRLKARSRLRAAIVLEA